MKTLALKRQALYNSTYNRLTILGGSLLLLFMILTQQCKKDSTTVLNNYQVVNLVSETAGYGATRIDPNLSNAWGIAIGPTGSLWISSNHKGLTTIYDRNGSQLLAPVSIPFQGVLNGGAPTGAIYNSTTDFKLPGTTNASKFIYAGEHGTIDVWYSGTSTLTVSDRSGTNAVYKGIAMASDGGTNYLYVTNFKGRKIEVFDKNFNYVDKPFLDAGIPAGFGPFNIQNIDGNLYVSYAKLKGPDNEDDESGVGNGYVDVFSPAGAMIRRFASQGTLNSPWGIAKAPAGFGQVTDAILIGNFGDGKINVYDSSGAYQGQLKDGTTPISVDGLWAITFPQNGIPAGDQNQLLFTAGPDGESHGVFGYIKLK